MKIARKIAALLCLAFLLCGCSLKKEAVEPEIFAASMSAQGYAAEDVTRDMGGKVEGAVLAQGTGGAYQIEFYKTATIEQAKLAFEQNKATFQAEKKLAASSFSTTGLNYEKYSIKSDGWYRYVCRVENTFVYASVPEEYKDAVKRAVESIGY